MTGDRAELLGSERVFEGARIRVRRDRLRDASGRDFTREVVEHPGAAVVIPLLDDGRVVLIRQYRHALGDHLLEAPAGTLEPGEDPAICATRELAEETGYRAGKVEPLATVYSSPGVMTEKMYLYVARELEAGEPDLDPGEEIEVVLLDADAALRSARSGEIRDAKTALGLLLALSGRGQGDRG